MTILVLTKQTKSKHKLKSSCCDAIFELQILIFIIKQLMVQRNGAGNRVLSNNKFVPKGNIRKCSSSGQGSHSWHRKVGWIYFETLL